MVLPSGDHATLWVSTRVRFNWVVAKNLLNRLRGSEVPKLRSTAPDSTSNILMVPSFDPPAILVPSGDQEIRSLKSCAVNVLRVQPTGK